MELDGCKRIAEVTTTSARAKDVNEYLDLGWKLIAVATMATDSREWNGPMTKYTLGWFSDEPAPTPAPEYMRNAL